MRCFKVSEYSVFMCHGEDKCEFKRSRICFGGFGTVAKWVNKDCSIAGFRLGCSANTIRIALEKEIKKPKFKTDYDIYVN